jgi:hypothetical protein
MYSIACLQLSRESYTQANNISIFLSLLQANGAFAEQEKDTTVEVFRRTCKRFT